nr:hypothetical protein [Tanacetum cinerariifolium]
RSGPTRHNLRVFGKTGPDRRSKWSKTPDRDRTDYPSVQSGLCRAGQMETSATREYPSLIHTFFLTHTVGGVFLNPEDKAFYRGGGCGDDEPGDDEDGGED